MSLREKLACILLLFVVIVTCLLYAADTGMKALSAVRAYVGGEGRWSKGQKDAVHFLTRYVESGDEQDYEDFRAAIAVPLGDRAARLELEKPVPDLRTVHRGFIQGRNHTEDIPGMTWVVRRFGRISYIARALAVWARADRYVLKLRRVGDELHGEHGRTRPPPSAVDAIRNKIVVMNRRLTPLEDDFSQTLGEGARRFESVLLRTLYLATWVLLTIGTLISWMLLVRIRTWEARYRHLLDAANDAIIVTDLESGLIVDANRKAEGLTGLPVHQLVGTSEVQLRPPAEQSQHRDFIVTCARTGQVTAGDVHIQRADGQLIDVEISASVTELSGRPVVQGIFRDISDRMQTEAALKRSERELADFFENAAVGSHCAGPDGVILRVNQAELDLLGYAREEYVGRNVAEFHVDPQAFHEVFARLSRNEPVHEWQTQMRCKDGSTRHVLIDVNARWEDGALVQTRCFTRDLSDYKRVEAEVQRSLSEVEDARRRAEEQAAALAEQAVELTDARNAALEAARVKAEFLANMSHEIRTPLTAIIGYTHLLADPDAGESERHSYLDTIRRNGVFLQRIINDILDLSKIEAGKMTIERISCSPVQIVSEVASLMRPAAVGKGLTFDVEYQPPVPARIHADPTRVRQILVNLIGNAIKFTECGGVRVILRMAQSEEATRPSLSFEVVDTGIGIAADARGRLFVAFSQADTSMTRRFGGTGLGLTISKRLAETLGGDVTVQSTLGEGSRFVLHLETGPLDGVPMLDDPGEAAIPEPASATGVGPNTGRLRGRILLVEDAPDNQKLVSFYLRRAGAQVETAEDGLVACEAVLSAANAGAGFDVILMDMQMPRLDGYGATARLRSAGYAKPIIALTAHAMEADRERCLRTGCDDFLTKPIDPEVLLGTIQRYLPAGGGARPPASSAPTVSPLERMLCNPELAEIVTTFVAGLAERAAALERCLAEKDLDALLVLAHRLKGTAGGFGFPEITEAAAELERSTKARDGLDELSERLRRVTSLCRAARESLPQTAPLPSSIPDAPPPTA